MTSPFSDRDQRIAFFQQFSDTIPHSKALGLKIIAVRRGFGSCSSSGARSWLATRDGRAGRRAADGADGQLLRHVGGDYADRAEALRDARPAHRLCAAGDAGKAVIAEAGCYRVTHSVAFTRAFAHQRPKDPIAAAAGTFMLGTKGGDAPAVDRHRGEGMSSLLR